VLEQPGRVKYNPGRSQSELEMSTHEAFSGDAASKACVVIPIFNDWDALQALLPLLDAALIQAGRRVDVLILDDGSTEAWHERVGPLSLRAIDTVRILELRRNLGHQRALAVGLAYIDAHALAGTVIVMDGDGEDAPADVPSLLDRYDAENGRCVVFAERQRRSESVMFKVFYLLYRWTHVIMTGRRVRVGNFSVLPASLLHRLVVVSELWNHYAAAVYKARLPVALVPTARARRLGGRSSMNYVNLVVHGLSAISVYSETIGARALAASLALVALSVLGIGVIVGIRFLSDLAIPGWATMSVGILLVILLQAALFSTVFSFTTLANRQGLSFLPARDYGYFVGRITDVYPRAG
jgi:glycosyltransferase involved in cell wall biosynthesis